VDLVESAHVPSFPVMSGFDWFSWLEVSWSCFTWFSGDSCCHATLHGIRLSAPSICSMLRLFCASQQFSGPLVQVLFCADLAVSAHLFRHDVGFGLVVFPYSATRYLFGTGCGWLSWRWRFSSATDDWVAMIYCSCVPTWLVASTKCRGRKSLAAIGDEKAQSTWAGRG
jgi:hypothetical protein